MEKANGAELQRLLQIRKLKIWDHNHIEDLGWSRLGLRPSEMMEVMEDREVWRLNLELLPPQPLRKSGQ